MHWIDRFPYYIYLFLSGVQAIQYRMCFAQIGILIICTSFSHKYKQSSIECALLREVSLLYVQVLVRIINPAWKVLSTDDYLYYMYQL